MTLCDLSTYRVSLRKPISITYRNHTIYSCGAPSGGSVALSILKTIEGYAATKNLALETHCLDEAMRFSYAARLSLGDPDFFSYMDTFESRMLTPETASSIRSRIPDDTTHQHILLFTQNYFLPTNHGTSHIVATDATGLSITLTSTINLLFSSQLVVPETGVIMNNEINDFSIPGVRNAFGFVPSSINYIRPHKRPLSSISPLMSNIQMGRCFLALGRRGEVAFLRVRCRLRGMCWNMGWG